jgi:hypothetical protein
VPIPNADHAIIAVEKLTAYMLNTSHKRGGTKARLLISLGYRTNAPEMGAAFVPERHANVAECVRHRLRDGRPDYDAKRKNRTFLLNLADRYWKRSAAIHYYVS